MKKAVLDIGSNTIRLLIAEVSSHPYKKIHYQHHVARLGEGLQQTGLLGVDGKRRALDVFKEVTEVCSRFAVSPGNIKAVATAAIREATNGGAFVNQVLEEVHLHIEVISGESEAALALAGARLGLPDEISEDMLLFDIGGASTEFNRVIDGDLVDSLSQKMGVVRLKEQFMRKDPVSVEEYTAMKQHTCDSLDEVKAFWGENKLPKYLVGTAGTVTALAAIAQDLNIYDADKINGYCLTKENFIKMRDCLLAKTNEERLLVPMLEKGREDVIVAGLAMVESLFEYWKYNQLITVDAGLLEGLLLKQN
ncbi:MAG: Ppx/GppA family phosphatase [Ghiorsea sp.]